VYEVDDIGSDSNAEDSGEGDVACGSLNDVFAGSPVGVVEMHNLFVIMVINNNKMQKTNTLSIGLVTHRNKSKLC
jgi:hypothetical protein